MLSQITNSQTSLSYIGVRGFFIISGHLIFQSLQRSNNLLNYYWKRVLRLFPALIVVLLLTIFLGALFYDKSIKTYFLNQNTWSYFLNNITLYNLQFGINGVLNNESLNGSLWTIRYEFSFYIIISLLYIFKNKTNFTKYILTTTFILLVIGKFYLFTKFGNFGKAFANSNSINLGIYFIAGALLASVNIEKIINKYFLISICIILLSTSFFLNIFFVSQFFLLPLLIITIGNLSTNYINSISQTVGDISYGIYIYSFPVQQILIHFFNISYLELMVVSIFISIIFGIISWNFVEKKALRFKNIKFNKVKNSKFKFAFMGVL